MNINAWCKALKLVLDSGITFVDNENRSCVEVLNHSLVFSSVDADSLLNEMRKYDRWSFPSAADTKRILSKKEFDKSYSFTIGNRLFNYRGVLDQINGFVIPLLKKDINSRRALVTLYDPEHDSKLNQKMYPSITNIFFKVQNSRLLLSCFFRSNDLLLGMPIALSQLAHVQSLVASSLGFETGTISVFSGSLHFYEDNKDVVLDIIERYSS